MNLQSRQSLLPLMALLAWSTAAPVSAAAPPAAGPEAPARFIRIGHYQCVCRQGDFRANLATVVEGLRLAADARLDLLSFPESLLTGYFPAEADARTHSFAVDSPEMREVLARTAGFDSLFMVGFNERRDGKLYNTVAVIERGRVLGTYSKALLVYRYFEPGREFPVFEKKGLKFGVIICKDSDYIEPARILALKGARAIFAPHFNFVPDPVAHYQNVRNDHVARAVENGVYFIRGNNVVRGDQLDGNPRRGHGYGDSYVLDPNGEIAASAGLGEEYLMIYNLDLQKKYRALPSPRGLRESRDLDGLMRQALEAAPAPARR